ncbi:hypothetical protein [Marinobacter piscensis]|uniref:hypothetical protein n=1 Tax=Marinobacter piscensis TaxID=1562308 RepID=UPI00119E926B|nr:hypothetical protein [Marinobacter piscensis]
MSKKVSAKPMTKSDAARIQSATAQQNGGQVPHTFNGGISPVAAEENLNRLSGIS